jgi:hypothetical protein
MSKIGNGTYALEYSKKGYGTIKIYGIQVFGNDTVNIAWTQLCPMPVPVRVPATPLVYTYPALPEMQVHDIVLKLTKNNVYIVFFDTQPNVTYKKYKSALSLASFFFNNDWTNEYKLFNTRLLPFKSGTTVYFSVYSFNPADQGYLDTYLGIYVFPTINPDSHSNVLNFIMP